MSLLLRRSSRMRHNAYDARCVHWFGDRSPARNRRAFPMRRKDPWKPMPLVHREMNGGPVMLGNQRCPVCNPYTETEAQTLIG